jgi:chromatin remodeling complex protein RSC6
MAKAKKKATAKAPKKSASTKKTAKAAAKPAKGKPAGGGFMKALEVSPELQAVIGTKTAPRTEVTKRLWAYIKKNNCQDPKNKRDIIADDKLKAVFGKAKVNMFEMTKLVGKHLK